MGAVSHFFFSSGVAPSSTQVRYSSIVGGQVAGNLSFSLTAYPIPISVAGKIRTIGVSYTGVPLTTGQSFAVQLVVNGNVIAGTIATLDSTHNSVIITPNTPLNANDNICLRWTPSGSPDVTGMIIYSHIVFEATASDRMVLPGIGSASATTTPLYLPLYNNNTMAAIGLRDSMMPCAGTINGFVVHSVVSTNTATVYTTYTLCINGVAQPMTVVHNDVSGINPTVYSTGAPIHVNKNDLIVIQRTGTGTISSQLGAYSIDFTPDNQDDYPIFGNSASSQWSSTQLSYMAFSGAQTNNTVETGNLTFIAEAFNFSYLQFWMSNTSNGGATHRNITLRQNGVSVGTAFDFPNLNGATTYGANVNVNYAANDNADILQQPPAGGITVGNWKMGGVLRPIATAARKQARYSYAL